MSYRVAVTREDGVWVADVLDVPGAHASASGLEELQARVQEVLGLVLDRPEAERFELELEFVGSARLLSD
jgi:predicted RNase H-like HicB family nuclease